jgi:hypothetical protein
MELEGVKDVRPAEEDQEYYFNVMCGSCREEHPKVVSLNMTVSIGLICDPCQLYIGVQAEYQEEHEISGSRGSAHFVWRCGNCKVSMTVLAARRSR